MSGARRFPAGGLIDRTTPLHFSFDGRVMQGFRGDTLASALAANAVKLVGRSFKYHRPRGLVGAGSEEPNALVQVGTGTRREPNTKATQIALYDGLVAESQNRFPSLKFDLLGVNDWASPILTAGFYYKTFKWPRMFWPLYEQSIRKVAGLGKPPSDPDLDHYDERWHHCDILVVGGGPAGLAAARSAARSGARVTLVDENFHLGGWLRRERLQVDGAQALGWLQMVSAELAAEPRFRLIQRTTVFGYYDHNFLAAIERLAEPGQVAADDRPQQRLWRIRAKQVILATGAFERPLVFANNDRPGVMLAGAARGLVNEFAVRPGTRVVIATNNDSAYATAVDLFDAGIEIAAVVDVREVIAPRLRKAMLDRGIPTQTHHAVVNVGGRSDVRHAEIASIPSSTTSNIACDLVCMSGGWNPAVHLHAQAGGTLRYDNEIAAILPDAVRQRHRSAGAARGRFTLAEGIADGINAAQGAVSDLGLRPTSEAAPRTESDTDPRTQAVWRTPISLTRGKKAFVDFQNDVTVADIEQAVREGYASVEHLKRYTTLGMGTDQGKTSNVNGLAILAAERGEGIGQVGTTRFRPPYAPVTLSALAAEHVGPALLPLRRSPLYDELAALNAAFQTSGLWHRPRYLPKPGEDLRASSLREARAVRNAVGITDVSTLGKIEISGRDAGRFLDRIYTWPATTLRVGRARYSIMLREDGCLFDDGTLWRLGDDRFFATTSTMNAENVLRHLELHRDTAFATMDVDIANVTEQWAAIAVAGPASRELLSRLLEPGFGDNATLPSMAVAETKIGGLSARVARISYSGERAYEIYVPSKLGPSLWNALLRAGTSLGVTPYGLEALELLRIEKGHIGVGSEIDGRTTPDDLGLARMLKGEQFVGKLLVDRPAMKDPERLQLVGLKSCSAAAIPDGAQLISSAPKRGGQAVLLGHVSSAGFSVALGKPIALALLKGGRARHGEELVAAAPLAHTAVRVRVAAPVFVDPDGARLRE